MAQITLTEAAIRHLLADPKLRVWSGGGHNTEVPILGYYRRSYLKSRDGSIIEYGDGFMLTFDHPREDWDGQGLADEKISVGSKIEILVLGPKPIFTRNFTINCNGKKYTFE